MNLHDLTPADFVEAVEGVEAHTHHTGENSDQKRLKESEKIIRRELLNQKILIKIIRRATGGKTAIKTAISAIIRRATGEKKKLIFQNIKC